MIHGSKVCTDRRQIGMLCLQPRQERHHTDIQPQQRHFPPKSPGKGRKRRAGKSRVGVCSTGRGSAKCWEPARLKNTGKNINTRRRENRKQNKHKSHLRRSAGLSPCPNCAMAVDPWIPVPRRSQPCSAPSPKPLTWTGKTPLNLQPQRSLGLQGFLWLPLICFIFFGDFSSSARIKKESEMNNCRAKSGAYGKKIIQIIQIVKGFKAKNSRKSSLEQERGAGSGGAAAG